MFFLFCFKTHLHLEYTCSNKIFGDNYVLKFGGETLGHSWNDASSDVALEVCVQAHNERQNKSKMYFTYVNNLYDKW